MKLLISFIFVFLLVAASTSISYACSCKHEQQRCCNTNVYYAPVYCERSSCSRCGEMVCYYPRSYECRTEYYYRDGRNSAQVVVCD